MLNLSRLQLLHELSVLGTISAVARSLNLTRPAVSQQLSLLEKEVGLVLFERSGRGVRWTSAGERLLSGVSNILHVVNEVETDLAKTAKTVTGELKIAAFGSAAATIIPQAITRLAKEHPSLDIFFNEMEPGDGLKATAAKQVDIAIVDDLTATENYALQLDFEPLYIDPFKAVVSTDHRLANTGRRSIELWELAQEKWALNQSAFGYQTFIVNACHAEGYTPQIMSSCRNIAATLEFVRTGDYVTVLPGLATHNVLTDPDFHCLDLRPITQRRLFSALAKGNRARPAIHATLIAFEQACALYSH
ncbi:LysR family transcriptional regulator [Agrobacterium fabacearum S56]|uniref:LysR family transcriptional regulator n=1 Tax=Agrobacterium tumefaciens TaxID=358 RepID=UPI0009B96A1C|nr:LysR family transcriptional regulator [Agrobacterium tumefaciens]CUX07041.1 LysR family transcriptional regulator [Agrobacterium fabacearum S56]